MAESQTAARIAFGRKKFLMKEGVEAVTVRRMADVVGTSSMAIHKHYVNREVLLNAIAGVSFEELGKAWSKPAEVVGFDERFAKLLDAFLDLALARPHLYTFLHTTRREEARCFPTDFRGCGSRTYSPIMRVIEQGIHEGLLRSDDALEVTLVFVSGVQGLVQLYQAGHISLSKQDFRAPCLRSVRRILDGVGA
ncbi:WHG domain-containing protein [Pendulispora rubella]|uniref:WHG domain-containing protein n=1 Tax=Pendulispora rubella TaxID=2741070 RepID=A0ABZ2L9G1_9BACT